RMSVSWSIVFVLLLLRPDPSHVPYTSLFRSGSEDDHGAEGDDVDLAVIARFTAGALCRRRPGVRLRGDRPEVPDRGHRGQMQVRSEEHTSELQSRENRACRLLPEKINEP